MELLQDLSGRYQEAFGAADCSSDGMKRAVCRWIRLYYGGNDRPGFDGCLRIPYTIVRKLSRAVFAEYQVTGCPVTQKLPARQAMELAMIAGECYLKPGSDGFYAVSRGNVLIFGRDLLGEPTDIGLLEKSRLGKFWFTLLERRTLDEKGMLTVTNRLYRSGDRHLLGREVRLQEHPAYAELPQRYTWPQRLGSVGMVRVKMPMANCVDGSGEGVSVYAAAEPLIEAIAENEAQLKGEFRRGQSRLVVSRDMLRDGKLKDDIFVGLDESPDMVGITVFSPQLREQAYLARQQAYLRGVENIIGLKRGLLSQVEAVDRTATEITSSEGEYMTTVRELQQVWQEAAGKAARLWKDLGLPGAGEPEFSWGDGVL